MSQKVVIMKIKRQPGCLYFIDRQGDISLKKENASTYSKIAKCGIKKEKNYYYYLDSQGDISRCKTENLDELLLSNEILYKEFAGIEENGEYLKHFNVDNRKDLKTIKDNYEKQEEKSLIAKLRVEEREKIKIERLRQKARQEILEEEFKKIPEDEKVRYISDEIKEFVWRRDQGKCIKCGSQENLEFDHIIPFSKGGSNTARNIQLLCEKCNRSKKDKI